MPALRFNLPSIKKPKRQKMRTAKGKPKIKSLDNEKGTKRILAEELQQLQADFYQANSEFRKRGMRYAINKDFLHDGSFYQAIAPVLMMAQFFCLMPVFGVCGKSIYALEFRWRSIRTCYCICYVITVFISTFLTIHMLLHDNLDARNLQPLMFNFCLCISSVYFLYLASKWPQLMQHWARVEQELPPYNGFTQRERLPKRIKMVSFVFFMLSFMEHLLSTISAIHYANYCPARPNHPIESYFVNVNPQIFSAVDYNVWLALLGKAQNVLMTFGWSYTDIFLMNIGIGLSELFVRLYDGLSPIKGRNMPEYFWTRARLQYRMICDLIAEVDRLISGIVMLSFASNLYFVCIQCLRSLNKMPSAAHAVYFYFSLFFLLGRTLAVSLFLAEVNDRASQPLLILKHVPTESYYIEVERFADEIAYDVVALTGMKFFTITRTLVLKVAGTIVTYELVLIQFHEDQNLWHCGTD